MWLDELEETRGEAVEMSEILGLEPKRIVIDLADFDRFIEIVKRAEWSTEGLYRGKEVRACPLCLAREPVSAQHVAYCPYSDEWRKK
jgi:hypothetical protein